MSTLFLILSQWTKASPHGSFVSTKKMAIKKTIAIIGAAGKMGRALAKSLAKGPFRLLLFDRNPKKLGLLARKIKTATGNPDLESSHCPVEASWEADIIIPAVPYAAQHEVVEEIKNVITQKIVISLFCQHENSHDQKLTAHGMADALQTALPHAKIVEAFTTVSANDFKANSGKELTVLIAGKDEGACETVAELVRVAGFHPVVESCGSPD
jgi:8-hydroxy-5-deazaflavin:NADPH oxidoreductase